MTSKAKRAQYTLEFKMEAVRLVKAGQSMAAAAATLGVVEQTLYNWVKADREGKLAGAGTKPVSPEQMELARLRAEVARLKMERDILKKRPRTSPRSRCEVRVHRAQSTPLASLGAVRSAGSQSQRISPAPATHRAGQAAPKPRERRRTARAHQGDSHAGQG